MSYSIIFFLLMSSLILLKPENEIQEPKIYNPFEDAIETKIKYFYDFDDITKTPLAVINIVTKHKIKKLFWEKIENASNNDIEMWNIAFAVPLQLANGKLIFDTKQLAYYLK